MSVFSYFTQMETILISVAHTLDDLRTFCSCFVTDTLLL